MLKPVFKLSPGGFTAAGLFLLLATAIFAWIFFVASKNPADSGESGIIMLPLMMPWITIMPETWVGPLAALGCILLNALILYFLFGGFRITKRSGQSSSSKPD